MDLKNQVKDLSMKKEKDSVGELTTIFFFTSKRRIQSIGEQRL